MKDKIVLITGASSGIGASCAKLFAQLGAKLILIARRETKLQELATTLPTESLIINLDIRDRQSVASAIDQLSPTWSNIDILINNAGLSRGLDKLHEGNIDDWEEMIDTNLKGLLYITRQIVPIMVKRNIGHIINIGSIAGHQTYPGGSVYCATKAGVRAINEGLKQDLLGTPIRVTSIDPGLLETEFSIVRFHGDTEKAKQVYQGLTPLTPDDVAQVILFCATRPPHVNISELLLVPTDQATPTLVHRHPTSVNPELTPTD